MVEEIFFTDLSIKTSLQSDEGRFEKGFDGIPGFEGSLKIPDAPGFEMRVKRELGHVNRQQGDDDQGDEQGNPPRCRGIRIQVTDFDRQRTVSTPVEFVTLMKALLQGFSRPSENQEHPLVAPQDAHLRQEPLRTMVNCPQVPQGSPSYPFIRAS